MLHTSVPACMMLTIAFQIILLFIWSSYKFLRRSLSAGGYCHTFYPPGQHGKFLPSIFDVEWVKHSRKSPEIVADLLYLS